MGKPRGNSKRAAAFAEDHRQLAPMGVAKSDDPRRSDDMGGGLCNCCSDTSSCFYGAFCPSCQFGSNASAVCPGPCPVWCSLGCVLSHALCCIPRALVRQRVATRTGHQKPGFCTACCTTMFCSPCASCQEARALRAENL